MRLPIAASRKAAADAVGQRSAAAGDATRWMDGTARPMDAMRGRKDLEGAALADALGRVECALGLDAEEVLRHLDDAPAAYA